MMHHRSARRLCCAAAVCGTAVVGSAVAAADNPDRPAAVVQYEDDFSYAAGGRVIQVDGREPVAEGEIHCSMFPYGRPLFRWGGGMKLIMTEEHSAKGPDGQPGVLGLEFADVPTATDYAGFVVSGNKQAGDITIPGWTPGEVTVEDLNRTFVTVRFRADDRKGSEDFSVPLNFRLAPAREDSLYFAADFGTLVATERWRTLKRPIGSAKNLGAFLANLNHTKPDRFKFVWSQAGPSNRYQPGDTLLIDDLRITIESRR